MIDGSEPRNGIGKVTRKPAKASRKETHCAWEQFPPENVAWITPSTAYVLLSLVSACTVVTLGTWFHSFDPSVGMRACFSATICAAPTAVFSSTISVPSAGKKSANVVVDVGSSVSA